MSDNKLGIWDNEECLQCGACCRELYEQFAGPCPEQTFKDDGTGKKSYCKVHYDKEPLCADFFCGDIDHEIAKEKLRKIAIELGTVPKGYSIYTTHKK